MKRLGDDVSRELDRVTGSSTIGIAAVVEAWPAAVGETIARNAWPARIARDGTLHVNTADAIWAFELTTRAAEIAQRVGLDRARFAPGRLPEASPATDEAKPDAPLRPSAHDLAEGERLAADIEDENLRKIVARAAAASLSRAVSDRSF